MKLLYNDATKTATIKYGNNELHFSPNLNNASFSLSTDRLDVTIRRAQIKDSFQYLDKYLLDAATTSDITKLETYLNYREAVEALSSKYFYEETANKSKPESEKNPMYEIEYKKLGDKRDRFDKEILAWVQYWNDKISKFYTHGKESSVFSKYLSNTFIHPIIVKAISYSVI
jgi:hypothetical protein